MAKPLIAPRPAERYESANEAAFRRMVEILVTEVNAELAQLRTAIVPLTSLPTTDPAVAGQVWNDGGVLKASSGP